MAVTGITTPPQINEEGFITYGERKKQKKEYMTVAEYERDYFGVPSSTPDATAYRTYTAGNTGTNSGSWDNIMNPFILDGSEFPNITNCPPIIQPKEKEMATTNTVKKLIREIIKDPAKEALIEKHFGMESPHLLFLAMIDHVVLYEAALALEVGAREEEE